MKWISAPAVFRGTLVALWLVPQLCGAATLTWSNTLGSVTLFGSDSSIGTSLETSAMLGSGSGSDSLFYPEASTTPAISRADAFSGAASFSSLAQLSVTESQETGMPFTSGGISFSSENGGESGSGSGAITLYFLISVPSPVVIDLSGVRSTVTSAGPATGTFAMSLYQSDATGSKIGGTLLNFSGNAFDAEGSYQTSAAYYLLEMNVSANALSGSAGSADFSYQLNLVAVPEPGVAALFLAAFISVCLAAKWKRPGLVA